MIRQKSHPDNPDPRVLLLHGFTGDHKDWDWWPQARLTALAMDLPGHSASPDPVGTYDEAIEHLLASLPPSIDRLVGYSLGGRIALSLIAKAPARFSAACIISAHPGLEDDATRAARKITDRDWIQLLETQGLEAFVQAWEAQPLFASQQHLDPTLTAAQRATRLSHRAQGLAASLRCFGLGEMPPTWDAIRQWPGQLHWLVGGADRKFSAIARDLQASLPLMQLCELPGIGHNPPLEAPEQARSFCLDAMHVV